MTNLWNSSGETRNRTPNLFVPQARSLTTRPQPLPIQLVFGRDKVEREGKPQTKLNETWQKARSQCPLPSLCVFGRSEKTDGRPGLWLDETFFNSPLNRWTEFNETWLQARSQSTLPSFVFSGWGQEKKSRVSATPTDPILCPRPYRFYCQICLYKAKRTI